MRGAASQHRQNFTTLRSFASLLPLQLSKLFPHPPNPPATLTPSMHTTNPLATAIHVIIAQHTQLFHIHSRSIQYTSWGFPEDGLFGHGVFRSSSALLQTTRILPGQHLYSSSRHSPLARSKLSKGFLVFFGGFGARVLQSKSAGLITAL